VSLKGGIQMIRVIAIVTVKEGKRKNYLEEVYKIMPLVHIEDGCIEYGPHIDGKVSKH
jgi:quinol monooxygenase YgiN